MSTLITILAVAYFLIGLVIYAITDTSKFARKIENLLLAVPLGEVLRNMFLFVVILWPVWLVINAKYNE